MNSHSVLCRFLSEHPDNWSTLLFNQYNIKSKTDGNYAIFNYGFDADFSNPIVQESRGIILNIRTLEVACWPFRKFGNHTESYADPIDWSHAKVLEKVDGSIIKLWFDPEQSSWQFSTNAMIRAEAAFLGDYSRISFQDVIRRAENYGSIPFPTLDRSCTYIFELVSPETQVVVSYPGTMLYHIGTRNNITGQESDVDIGIQKPKAYPISSLSQCVEAALTLNSSSDNITAEGFVVVDRNWNRVKVKSPDYILRHHLVQMKSITKRECLQLLLADSGDISTVCQVNPNLIPVFKFYDYQLARLRNTADRLVDLTRMLYEEYSHDRSAVAAVISRHRFSWIGFRSIGNQRPGSEILMDKSLEWLIRQIPDYVEEDLSTLFLAPESANQ